MNPRENLWNELEKCVFNYKFSNSADFLQKLQEEWKRLTIDDIQQFFESMSCNCAAVRIVKDMAIKY